LFTGETRRDGKRTVATVRLRCKKYACLDTRAIAHGLALPDGADANRQRLIFISQFGKIYPADHADWRKIWPQFGQRESAIEPDIFGQHVGMIDPGPNSGNHAAISRPRDKHAAVDHLRLVNSG